MAGIVGVDHADKRDQVTRMLDKIAHRGTTGSKIVECHETTLTEVLDRERVTIAASLGVHARPALRWLKDTYLHCQPDLAVTAAANDDERHAS